MKEQPTKEKSENQKVQDFVTAYNQLCKKHNLQIVTTPAWRISQDTGDWRLVIQSSVGKLPKNE
jgi:flagellar capping protein FliD